MFPCLRGTTPAASLALALCTLTTTAAAQSADAYRPVRATASTPACACSGVTTTSAGYGTPYAPPSSNSQPSYRALDNSPRYVAPQRGDVGRPSYLGAYDPPAIWTGSYLGAHLGYGWGKTGISAAGLGSTSTSGGIGGLHGGYNWQSGNVVFGAEGDLSLSWMDGSSTFTSGGYMTSHPGWTSSIRGRLGYAFNNFLVYGTTGLALTSTNFTVQQGGSTTQSAETQFGYVIGAGVDMKIAPQISARVEALHYGFADKNINYNGAVNTPLSNDMTTLRAGLTFHFN
jgi:outer membrane immunogenic protein